MIEIRITWFKESGKMYTNGMVKIPEGIFIWSDNFKQAIVDNQNSLIDGWINDEFYVVIDTTEAQDKDPEFKGFYTHLFKPGAFKGIKKSDPTIPPRI